MPEEDLIELKFRLYDGSDIGPFQYAPTSTIAILKERIVADWPKGSFSAFLYSFIFASLTFLFIFPYLYNVSSHPSALKICL